MNMIGFALKITGMGLIVGGSIIFGQKYSHYRNRKVIVLETIHKTMCMMREKILRENTLLEVCMASCGQMYAIPEGNLFEEFSNILEQGKSPESHWKDHVCTYLKRNGFNSEALCAGLCELENAFTQMNTDSLVASLDAASTFLEKEVEQEKEKCKKEGPLIQKVSVALGILLCVMLY